MRISDWSSDVCSSDLLRIGGLRIDRRNDDHQRERHAPHDRVLPRSRHCLEPARHPQPEIERAAHRTFQSVHTLVPPVADAALATRRWCAARSKRFHAGGPGRFTAGLANGPLFSAMTLPRISESGSGDADDSVATVAKPALATDRAHV